MNDVKKSLEAAKIPSHLEPMDIYRLDGKCPDGASIVTRKDGSVGLGCNVRAQTSWPPPIYSALATR